MKELIEMIARELVDHPQKISVTAIEGDRTRILRVSTANGEAGKLIGKQGRTVTALRTILNAIAAKEKKHYILEIADNTDETTATRDAPYAPFETFLKRHRSPRI
ncbi:MAG TPA: KH domain-containing protein [Desulfosarcina sp.]|nr:KH domain-containing protein [Desulfosarcina sp.]